MLYFFLHVVLKGCDRFLLLIKLRQKVNCIDLQDMNDCIFLYLVSPNLFTSIGFIHLRFAFAVS